MSNTPKNIEELFEPSEAEGDPPGGNGGGGRALFDGDPPGGNGGGGRLFDPERASIEQDIDENSTDTELA